MSGVGTIDRAQTYARGPRLFSNTLHHPNRILETRPRCVSTTKHKSRYCHWTWAEPVPVSFRPQGFTRADCRGTFFAQRIGAHYSQTIVEGGCQATHTDFFFFLLRALDLVPRLLAEEGHVEVQCRRELGGCGAATRGGRRTCVF